MLPLLFLLNLHQSVRQASVTTLFSSPFDEDFHCDEEAAATYRDSINLACITYSSLSTAGRAEAERRSFDIGVAASVSFTKGDFPTAISSLLEAALLRPYDITAFDCLFGVLARCNLVLDVCDICASIVERASLLDVTYPNVATPSLLRFALERCRGGSGVPFLQALAPCAPAACSAVPLA